MVRIALHNRGRWEMIQESQLECLTLLNKAERNHILKCRTQSLSNTEPSSMPLVQGLDQQQNCQKIWNAKEFQALDLHPRHCILVSDIRQSHENNPKSQPNILKKQQTVIRNNAINLIHGVADKGIVSFRWLNLNKKKTTPALQYIYLSHRLRREDAHSPHWSAQRPLSK